MSVLKFILVFSISLGASAAKFTPLDILDGKWNIKMNFNDMLTDSQRAQMKKAMAKLEELKKSNPQMAAQLAQVTKGLGVEDGTISKATCMTKDSMESEMNKMLSQESSSDNKCTGEIITSTKTMVEGKSKCGEKTHHYKIMVKDNKHMNTVITTHEGKKIHGTFTWLSAECKNEEGK